MFLFNLNPDRTEFLYGLNNYLRVGVQMNFKFKWINNSKPVDLFQLSSLKLAILVCVVLLLMAPRGMALPESAFEIKKLASVTLSTDTSMNESCKGILTPHFQSLSAEETYVKDFQFISLYFQKKSASLEEKKIRHAQMVNIVKSLNSFIKTLNHKKLVAGINYFLNNEMQVKGYLPGLTDKNNQSTLQELLQSQIQKGADGLLEKPFTQVLGNVKSLDMITELDFVNETLWLKSKNKIILSLFFKEFLFRVGRDAKTMKLVFQEIGLMNWFKNLSETDKKSLETDLQVSEF